MRPLAIRERPLKSGASLWAATGRLRGPCWSSSGRPISASPSRGASRDSRDSSLDSCHKDARQAAVYLCLHYSNFEWLSQFGAYTIANGPVIAQRFKNPLIGRIFDRLRSSTGHE